MSRFSFFLLVLLVVPFFLTRPYRKYASYILFLFGGTAIGGMGLSFLTPQGGEKTTDEYVFLVMGGIAPVLGGFALLYYNRLRDRLNKKRQRKMTEEALLALAQRYDHQLTPEDVEEHFKVPRNVAEDALDRMVNRNLAQLHVNPSGKMVYRIKE